MGKSRMIATILAVLILLLPFGAEAKKKHERKGHKPAAHNIKSRHAVARVPEKKVVRPAVTGNRHEAALAVYRGCMNASEPLMEAVKFLRVDRLESRVPLGNPERLGHELCAIDALKLKRYETLDSVLGAPALELVPIEHPQVGISAQLPVMRAVASPWVRDYVRKLAVTIQHEMTQGPGVSALDKSFIVSSLVRPMTVQKKQWNSPARCVNASSLCSSHTTGSTFDITRKYLISKQEDLLVRHLQEDRKQGKILFILEPKGNHYHIFVFPPELSAMIEPLKS